MLAHGVLKRTFKETLNQDRAQSISSGAAARRLHKALLAALEARRRGDGTIALTFEVIYGHAWKAVPRTTAEGHGIVRIEDIGRGSPRNR